MIYKSMIDKNGLKTPVNGEISREAQDYSIRKNHWSSFPLAGLSPAMKQYVEIKKQYPEAILFFQMGDFYELFFDDAVRASPILGIVLTSRSKKDDKAIPMCGMPLSAGLSYANKLTEQGYSVVVATQEGNTPGAKGIVERKVWQVGTPGMPLDDNNQAPGTPRYLAAVYPSKNGYGLAGLELSTGEMLLGRFDDLEELRAEFQALSPRECVLPVNSPPDILTLLKDMRVFPTLRPVENLESGQALEWFTELFGSHAVRSWDLEKWPEALSAAAGVLDYAYRCSQGELDHLSPPKLLWREAHLVLDEAAQTNLEILKTLRHGELDGSLLGLMDETSTAMGSRLLRQWLTRPLREAAAIAARHGAVDGLLRDGLARDSLVRLFKRSSDLERALSRVILKRGGPRDLAILRDTLSLLPEFGRVLSAITSSRLSILSDELPDLAELAETLSECLTDSPPLNIKDGGAIRRGVKEELDELMDLEKGGKNAIAALEARERERTGIGSLKVGFNRVYGYYLEVTKTNLHLVPAEWIRKQTIAGGERFLTPELKDWEEKISHAGERRLALEEEIFEELKSLVASQARLIKEAARILAEVDVLCAYAACAEKYGWVRAELTEEDLIDIRGGRHPVVEALLPPGEPFVANDVKLSTRERLLIITGPNMAGKNAIMRPVARVGLLSRAGRFVPAESARLSIRDRIFTRVGAADDLARGRSTFMVEMNETARILTMATPRSLVVLDEVGRGTSTYDGLSLAWAIAEFLHDLDGDGVPTLFATHYHELIALEKTKPRVRNYNVSVKNSGGRITFTRLLQPGGVSRSYGLAVASMAGLPKKVLETAREVMADFYKAGDKVIRPAIRQLDLFESGEETYPDPADFAGPRLELPDLIRRLAEIKAEEMTPLEALNCLSLMRQEAYDLLCDNED